MWKIFERTGGDYSIVMARHWRAMGLCCMVLIDDGSGGGETKVEGKGIAAVFKVHPLQRAGSFQKKKKKKKKKKEGNGPANWRECCDQRQAKCKELAKLAGMLVSMPFATGPGTRLMAIGI